VSFSLEIAGYSNNNPFTPADKSQLCSNINSLVPGGQCAIEYSFYTGFQAKRRRGLLAPTGSVVLTSTVVYSSNASAAEVQTVLSDPTDDQLAALISGLSGNPTQNDTFCYGAILSPLPAQPVVTTSTTTGNSWTASWTGDNSYVGYLYSCALTNIFDSNQQYNTTGLTGVVQNLSPSTTYYCYIVGGIEGDALAFVPAVTQITTKTPQ